MTLMAVLGVLEAPAALADKPAAKPDQNAAQQCRAQLEGMGAKDFARSGATSDSASP